MKKQLIYLASFCLALVALTLFAPAELYGLGTVTTAMAYALVSVGQPGPGAGTPGDKNDRIIIFRWDDIQNYSRVENQALIDGNITMKSGKYMIEIYGSLNTISPSYSSEGDPDAMGIIHGLSFSHPGDDQAIADFLQNNFNLNLGAIVRKCGSTKSKVYGSPCHPLQIAPTGVDDENKVAQEIVMTGINRTRFWPATYEGTFTLETVTGTFTADDVTPSVANGTGRYALVDNTAATEITTLDDAMHNGIYTLIGSGGSNAATIPTGNDFILKDGTTYTAIAGSEITFKAIKSGASAYTFVELSRS